jgi:hypothetical protein
MSRVYKEVIPHGVNAVGAARREIYIDAKDLQSEREDGTTMTAEEYLATLQQRGLEKLAAYNPIQSMESMVQTEGYIYGKDYVMGDTVTVKYATIGIAYHTPIEAVTRSGNKAEETVTLELGSGVLTVAQKLRNRIS